MDCIAFDFSPKREKAFPGRGRPGNALRTVCASFAAQLIRVRLIFDLVRAFLGLAGSFVRGFFGRTFHRVAGFLCCVFRGPSSILRGIFRFVPSVFHVLFRALVLRHSSESRARQGTCEEQDRRVFSYTHLNLPFRTPAYGRATCPHACECKTWPNDCGTLLSPG